MKGQEDKKFQCSENFLAMEFEREAHVVWSIKQIQPYKERIEFKIIYN